MNKVILIPSVVLGIVFILCYLLQCKRRKKEPNLATIVNSTLYASGIVGAVFLIGGSIFDDLKTFIEDLDLYIFISGVALMSVSAQGVYRDVFKTEPTKEKKKVEQDDGINSVTSLRDSTP